ncbi:hypothetical protein [Bacillus weihaiensis]|uniref:hypothetical protein n=1 Tax=Bacillus weihaiensis TaxID=1547283 RepID=UPI0023546D16|nr:hypothetical protein [Bacillus weihaiensis]
MIKSSENGHILFSIPNLWNGKRANACPIGTIIIHTKKKEQSIFLDYFPEKWTVS